MSFVSAPAIAAASTAAPAAVSDAAAASDTVVPQPPLRCGEVIVPYRAIGDCGPEKAVLYPSTWPEHIERVMKKRGDAPIRLYSDGCYDLCHYGHLRSLEQAKKSFPNTYLIVGCCNDADTHKYKGQTVMTEEERYESLRHCKWVDEIVRDAPWVISGDFLTAHDIDFVCHDDLPYVDVSGASASGDVYEPIKRMGKFHATQRTEGVSTSDLIIRIVKRYDDFVRRNMARGFSGREMGVPYIKEKTLQIEMALEKSAAAAASQLQSWADVAEEVHYEFLGMFSRDGPIVSGAEGSGTCTVWSSCAYIYGFVFGSCGGFCLPGA